MTPPARKYLRARAEYCPRAREAAADSGCSLCCRVQEVGAVVMLRVEGGVAVVTQQRLRVLPVFLGGMMTEQVDSCGGRRLRSFQGYRKVSPHFQGSSEDAPTTPRLQQVKYTRGAVKEGRCFKVRRHYCPYVYSPVWELFLIPRSDYNPH